MSTLTPVKCVDTGADITNLTFVEEYLNPSATDMRISPLPGPEIINRVSNRTRGVKLVLRGFFQPNYANATPTPNQIARFIVVYDKQSNGTVPRIDDVILTMWNTGTSIVNVFSDYNMYNRDRFIILLDKQIALPGLGVAGTTNSDIAQNVMTFGTSSNSGLNVYEEIDIRGLDTTYNEQTTGTIADVVTGGISIISIGGYEITDRAWMLSCNMRYYYYD